MKNIVRRIGSFVMVMVMLFSTMSFTVLQHYCGSELIEQSVFSQVDPCCGDTDSSQDQEVCCNNQLQIIEGQDELVSGSSELDFLGQVFLVSYFYSNAQLFDILSNEVVPFRDYTPPLLVTDIQLVDQVFLI